MISQGIFFCLAAYLFGSIPFGKIIANRVAGIDITTIGSRNIGATNVARELGNFWGILTLFLDILKGYAPIALYVNYTSQLSGSAPFCLSLVMLSSLFGHQFSIFLKMKGGKGVGTATGIYLAISPPSCLLAIIIFVLVVYKWDFISLGSMISSSAIPFLFAFFEEDLPLIICTILMAALICFKHRGNIHRIFNGVERKWRERRND